MNMRANAGYEIVTALSACGREIVLGKNELGVWVTWECEGGTNYYWGHYFNNHLAEKKDFCERLLERIHYAEDFENSEK